MNSRKPTPIRPWIASTRALRVGGRLRPNQATRAPNRARISTHRTIEPSWFPHTPVTLYSIGLAEWLLATTFDTVKSETT